MVTQEVPPSCHFSASVFGYFYLKRYLGTIFSNQRRPRHDLGGVSASGDLGGWRKPAAAMLRLPRHALPTPPGDGAAF